MLTFILFIIHVLVLPADNAQADENKLKGQSLQEPRSLQLVSVVAVLLLVRDAAAAFVAAAVEVVGAVVAVVADVAAEKDNVEKVKLVLFVTIPAADTWPQDCSYSQGETCRVRCSRTGIADQRRLALAPPSLTTLARC